MGHSWTKTSALRIKPVRVSFSEHAHFGLGLSGSRKFETTISMVSHSPPNKKQKPKKKKEVIQTNKTGGSPFLQPKPPLPTTPLTRSPLLGEQHLAALEERQEEAHGAHAGAQLHGAAVQAALRHLEPAGDSTGARARARGGESRSAVCQLDPYNDHGLQLGVFFNTDQNGVNRSLK